jgi:all-trans-8'-apo-beta-carotenal 15,15'-oxygenase
VAERKAGQPVYRGVFGTQKPGGWLNNIFDLRLKNIANTNVLYWGEKLLALWEAAEPYRLQPHNLETVGLDYLDGTLQPGDAFSAHPCIDPSCELDGGAPCLVNFAVKPGLSSQITIYEFNPAGQLLRRHRHAVPGFCFLHDFAITPHYCLFFQNPVTFNPLPYVFGWRGAGECVNFQANRPTRIMAIPRVPPYEGIKVWEVEAGFAFHHANAFEEGDRLFLDSVCYAALTQIDPEASFREVDFDHLAPGQLWRFTLNKQDNTVGQELISSRSCEFPSLPPARLGRPYRYLFLGATHHATGNAPLQAILKLDLHSGERQLCSFAPRGFVSEPIFVPKPDATEEDDGWVLVLVYDASHHRSDVVILDGRDLNRGALARLHLKQHIPYGLHGSWVPELF